MYSRDEYVRKMQAKLEEWNTEIDVLVVKADKVKVDVKNEYNLQIESLKVKQTDARQRIDEFQKAGDIALEDLKSGIEHAWKSMEEAVKLARSRFS